MNTTLSTQQVRLAAAVGLLAVAVLAWWVLVARQHSDSAAPAVAVPAHAIPTHHAKPVQHPSAARHAKPSSHATKSHAAAPVKIARHGLPLKVAEALTHHRVVVVSLSIPGVDLDRLAANESEAAAKASNAGFVVLDVVKQREGGPVLARLGVIDTPAVLVVKRHGSTVSAKFRGFVDRDTVEQAVADARR
jgi:hypothetical protein